jgi:Zn-finger nucleic acid-binding protein
MFGFLQLKSCGLTPEERLIYRSHFCSVCHAMTEFGGKVSSLLTNYDITFWLLLCSALDSGAASEVENRPCTALPFRKVAVRPLRPEVARTMASLNLLLVSSKVEDDRADGEKMKAGVASALFGKRFESARQYLKESDFPLKSVLGLPQAQTAAESDPSPTLDRLCQPTEHTLGEIFATISVLQDKPELESVLRDFGACLGGYLYLWDALMDRESDVKKGRFNAIEATGSGGLARLRADLYRRIEDLNQTLDTLALGPEGKLCYELLSSLKRRLRERLPIPKSATTPSPRRRLAKAGMVHTQDCCEIDCCECGDCIDCNICDCNPCEGEHCCELDCCDLGSLCCCCCDGSGSSSRRRSCICDDCTDIFCLESLCCGETRTPDNNFQYSHTRTSVPKPSLMQRFRNLTTSAPTQGDSSKRQCPCCVRDMVGLMVGQIQIEECRNCGGLWLDDQEIEVLARTGRLPHNLLNRYPVSEHPLQHLPGERSCPVCDKSDLVGVPYLGVPVEMCKGCHGFWLEHGSLRRVLKAKRSPKRLMKAHKKEWRCPYCEQVASGGADVCTNCGAPRPKSGFTGKLA